MPLFGGKEEQLSLQLIIRLKSVIEEFRVAKELSDEDIKILLSGASLRRLARDLGLNVKIEEMQSSSEKEQPIGIDLLLGRNLTDNNSPDTYNDPVIIL